MENKPLPLIKWQLPMKRVLYALVPAVCASIYFFGWRSLLLLFIVHIAGGLSEYAFSRYFKSPVSSSVFVTNTLFALALPPSVPLWIAVIGIIFAVVFGKMAFGGFGRNIFNPALAGRAFIYVSFPAYITAAWVRPLATPIGGLLSFTPDMLSAATPLVQLTSQINIPLLKLFLGHTSGCLGETSALAILIGGVYLVIKRTANYKIILSGAASFLVFQTLFFLFNIHNAPHPLYAVLSGGFLFGMFFMATDPVSASQTETGRWIYGAFIGAVTVLIRTFSVWAEGMMFAILLANIFAPIMDYGIRSLKGRKT
ncbi:RnfABCDGE type electron transport complex subunit D [Spirochaetota bacterium]